MRAKTKGQIAERMEQLEERVGADVCRCGVVSEPGSIPSRSIKCCASTYISALPRSLSIPRRRRFRSIDRAGQRRV